MPRHCSVCSNPARADIDRALARGGPDTNLSALGREHGVDRNSLRRHRDEHLPALLTRFAEEDTAVTVAGIRSEMRGLYERALDLLALAEAGTLVGTDEDGEPIRRVSVTSVARALREVRGVLTDLHRLAGGEGERETRTTRADLTDSIEEALRRVVERGRSAREREEEAGVVDVASRVVEPAPGALAAPPPGEGDPGLASTPAPSRVGGTPSAVRDHPTTLSDSSPTTS